MIYRQLHIAVELLLVGLWVLMWIIFWHCLFCCTDGWSDQTPKLKVLSKHLESWQFLLLLSYVSWSKISTDCLIKCHFNNCNNSMLRFLLHWFFNVYRTSRVQVTSLLLFFCILKILLLLVLSYLFPRV